MAPTAFGTSAERRDRAWERVFQAHRGNDAKIPSEHSQAGLSNRDYHLGTWARHQRQGYSEHRLLSRQLHATRILWQQCSSISAFRGRVDLATNGRFQPITAHVVLDLRHIDPRGSMRVMKLKFGILQGLRFNIVIGLYAISTHLVDVLRDLLAVQLEFLESGTPNHVSLLHGDAPHLLMM